jgi:hypothetical protein
MAAKYLLPFNPVRREGRYDDDGQFDSFTNVGT